jgi:acetate kinase
MAFLILNARSSSLKFSVVDHDDGSAQLCGPLATNLSRSKRQRLVRKQEVVRFVL